MQSLDKEQEEMIKLFNIYSIAYEHMHGYTSYGFEKEVAKCVGTDAAIMFNLMKNYAEYELLYLIGEEEVVSNKSIFIPSINKIQKELDYMDTKQIKTNLDLLIKEEFLIEVNHNGLSWYHIIP